MVRMFVVLLTLSLSTFWIFSHYFWDVVDEVDDGIVNNVDTFGFTFNEIRVRVDIWIWMLCEHLVIVGLAVVVFLQEQRYRKATSVFLGLQLVDTVGFVLTYEDPLKYLPFTFNEVKILIFAITIANELRPWKTNAKE